MAISFSIISEDLNRTSEYLARYGMENLDSFAEASLGCGNLQYYINRDMGVALPYPAMKFLPNLGQGEVIDGEPPSLDPPELAAVEDNLVFDMEDVVHELGPAKILEAIPVYEPVMHFQVEVTINFNANIEGIATTPVQRQTWKSKGNEKVLSQYSFNNDGLLTQEAIKILDEGILISFSQVFKGPGIDLEAEISHGIFSKDLLEGAVSGKLEQVLALVVPHNHTTGMNAIKIAELLAPKQSLITPVSMVPEDFYSKSCSLLYNHNFI